MEPDDDQNPQPEIESKAEVTPSDLSEVPEPETGEPAMTLADIGAENEAETASETVDAADDVSNDSETVIDEAPPLPREEVRAILEALIFAAPEPVTPRQLGQVLQGVSKEEREEALQELRAEFERPGRGLQLIEVAGGLQITTRPEYNDWIRELLDPKTPTRLTIQALETLAVIAYKQPVTLPEIIELRGVKSGGVIKTLLEKHLIRIVGRKEVVGRPILYGTTKHFLMHFGLKDLSELPRIEEFAEVLGEEVDVAGLKRAIETPTQTEAPLAEDAAGGADGAGDGEAQASLFPEAGPDDEVVAPEDGAGADDEN